MNHDTEALYEKIREIAKSNEVMFMTASRIDNFFEDIGNDVHIKPPQSSLESHPSIVVSRYQNGNFNK